jgi:hypothetical protein
MAVKRRFNPYSGIRVDIPHVRSLESAVSHDFDDMLRGMVTGLNRPLLIRGFDIQVPNAAINASSLKVTVADSAVLHASATESGTIMVVPPGTAEETLDPGNPRVQGAFQNGVANFVSLDYRRSTDLSTVDNSAGWSAAQKLEFQRTAPLGRVLDYRFVISSNGFGQGLPLYIVGVSSTGAFQYATKAVPGMFRLGSGGANPDPHFSFNWKNLTNPQPGAEPRREWINDQPSLTTNPVTVVPGADVNAFQFGDWSIKSLKEWMDAVMTRFKELTGSSYWYLDSILSGGAPSTADVWFDAVGSVLTGAGSISYNYILEAVQPTYGAFQSLNTDQSAGPTDDYVQGILSGTRAALSFFNAAQLVINSITNPSTSPFLYDEPLAARRIYRMDHGKSSMEDRTESSLRWSEFERTPITSASYVAISSWSYDDRVVTLNTGAPHGLSVGDLIDVKGLGLSSADEPPNGVYLAKSVPSSTSVVFTALFRFTGTTSVSVASEVRQERPFDATTKDFFRHPFATRLSISEWSYVSTAVTLVVPNHNFRAPQTMAGSVSSGDPEITGLSTTANIRKGQEVTGPGLTTGAYYVEEIVDSTTVRLNKDADSTTSGSYVFYDVLVASGLTASTNAPNGRHRVQGLGSGQFEVEITAGLAPTGTAGVALDQSSTFQVGYARYDRFDFTVTVTGAVPDEYNTVDAQAEAMDDARFRFVLGPDSTPPLGPASGAITFDGVVAISSVQNPIQVQSISGTSTITVRTYAPHGLITTAGPLTFTIFGDSSVSPYFRTYTNLTQLIVVDPQTFQLVGTGIVSASPYTNTDTTVPPVWSNVTAYSEGDVVEYPGASQTYYQALQTTTGDQPDTSPAFWELTYIEGEDQVFVKFSNNPYPGPIQWDQDLVVKGIIGDKRFVIPATATADGTPLANQFNVNGVTGTAYLQDGEVAYVVLERDESVSSGALYTTSSGNQVTGAGAPLDKDGQNLVAGDFVKFEDESEVFWFRIQGTPGTPIVSSTFFLEGDRGQPTTTEQRPSRTGKLVYTKASYDVVHVQPHWKVDPTADVYWIACRRDNGGLASKVYLRGLELEVGEVRQVNDNTTTNLLTYTGAGNESAINPNYSVIDQTGQYQFKQAVEVDAVEPLTRMVTFMVGPDLGFQQGDLITKLVGLTQHTWSIKEVLTSRTVIVDEDTTLLGPGDQVDYLRQNYVLQDTDNLTLGLRKEDRELARVNTALKRPIYDESFLVQQVDLGGSGTIASGNYVYVGPQDNPTFLAWVLHGTDPTVETIEDVGISMPGGHPSVGANAILVAIVSGSVTDGTTLFQAGISTGRTVNNPGDPPFDAPTIAGGLSNDGVEIAMPPNRRTQVVGSSYVQWPTFLTYKASTNGYLAGEELMVVINDTIREAEVDYHETFGGPKGKIRMRRDMPANTRIRARLMPAYGSALAARATGVTLQTAYDASFLNNYTVQELSAKPIILITGDQPTGGPALRIFGGIEMDSSFAGNVVGGIMGTADQKFDVGREANKPRQTWTAYDFVKTHSSHPDSAAKTITAAHTTTTASPTVIPGSEINLPVQASGKSIRVKAKATAWRSDGTYGTAAFEIHGLFYRGAGAIVPVGSPSTVLVGADGDGLLYALAFGISGDDIVVVAIGTLSTIQWTCTVESQAVSTST